MTVTPITLKMAADFYTRKLIELNPVLLVTPATLEKLNRQAEALRQAQRRRESNPVWSLPVRIEADGQNVTRFHVIFQSS